MQVIIKEREYEYDSDYPIGWKSAVAGYYKFPVLIGKYPCFIKRFDNRSNDDLVAWSLLRKIQGRLEPNLIRVFDIVSTQEKGEYANYVFYEYIKGNNLDNLILSNFTIDLKQLVNDLFTAFKSFHQHQYWYADFSEKDIYWDEEGRRFLLTAIDSAQPIAEKPYNYSINNEYWDLLLKYNNEVVENESLKPASISGPIANYLQVAFLILRLKMTLLDNKYEYNSSKLLRILPAFLDKLAPDLKDLFAQAFQDSNQIPDSSWIDQIKHIINQEIINGELGYSSGEEYTSEDEHPHVKLFRASSYEVTGGSTFKLYWETENTSNLKLFRNKAFYKDLNPVEGSIEIKEATDNKPKKLSYTLLASNESYQVESSPLDITITENTIIKEVVPPVKNTPVKEPIVPVDHTNTIKPYAVKTKSNSSTRLILLVLAVSLISIFLILFLFPFNNKMKVFFSESTATEGQTLVMFGENFPDNANEIQVLFNNVKGQITKYSEESLHVLVPEMGTLLGNSKVRVAVVAHGDTTYASTDLFIKAKTDTKSGDNAAISSVNLFSAPIETTTAVLEETPIPKDSASETKATTNTKKKLPAKAKKAKPKPPVKKTPLLKQEPKEVINIYELVSVKNDGFKKKTLGGIEQLAVTVQNNSRFDLDNVMVEISYQKKNEKVLGKKSMTFTNVKAHTSSTLEAPDSGRGKKVSLKITAISSAQLNKELQQ